MNLHLISASAGTGKTYTICQEVASAILKDKLDPARLVAATFTRKAAGELKARLQARILEGTEVSAEQRWQILDHLEIASIGTVHHVAGRFLSRYALELGIPPTLDILQEGDSGAGGDTNPHLIRLLDEQPPTGWADLEALAHRLGMKAADEVLGLVSIADTNGLSDPDLAAAVAKSTDEWLGIIGPPDQADTRGLADGQRIARDVLPVVKAAAKQNGSLEALEKVAGVAARGVATWPEAAGVAGSKWTLGVRDGGDVPLAALREFGAAIRRLPAFQLDLREFMRRAGEVAILLRRSYADYKRARALLDFTDLEVLFLKLLKRDDLADRLRQDLGMLVVDEFQDTSPLQLAIFRRLQNLSPRTVWVGDRKQAIYGFRGTDSGLVDAVWKALPGSRDQLDTNRRSQAGIVLAVNALFQPVFGADVIVKPHEPPQPIGLERWVIPKRRGEQSDAIAAGVQRLIAVDGIPAREIAILVRRNATAHSLAMALANAGVTSVLATPGLLSTRPGAAVIAGLRIVADRGDSLAAAELLHLLETDAGEATPSWFTRRLTEVINPGFPFLDHPLLNRLVGIPAARLAPPDLITAVIGALELPNRIATWGDPSRRAIDLDALIELGASYEEEARGAGTGATIGGLIVWLEALAEEGADKRPAPLGADAVRLVTYHTAKGLEWPVVVCADLDFERPPTVEAPSPYGGNPTKLDPLAGRTLRWWPWPFGFNEMSGGKPLERCGLQADTMLTDVGRAALASNQEEARRLLYVGLTRAKLRLVLAHPEDSAAWLNEVGTHVDATLGVVPAAATADGLLQDRKEWSTSIRYRRLAAVDVRQLPRVPSTAWIAEPTTRSIGYPARWASPAAAAPHSSVVVVDTIHLGGKLERVAGDPDRLGTALHAAFAALTALDGQPDTIRHAACATSLESAGAASAWPTVKILAAYDRLRAAVRKRWQGGTCFAEVPICGPRSSGGSWRGTIDLLVEQETRLLAIIDHKSTESDEDMPNYAGQLDAYAEAVVGDARPELWVHQPFGGTLVRLARQADLPSA